jgi:dephospho-CoA kinase
VVGVRNYLVEGVSGTGKTSVCRELNRRGYHAVNGDRDLAYCGGSRNFSRFIDPFDEVFVLSVDLHTLHQRLDQRPPYEWGSTPAERDLIVRLHRTEEDIPAAGVVIDATPPLDDVVDEILRHTRLIESGDEQPGEPVAHCHRHGRTRG